MIGCMRKLQRFFQSKNGRALILPLDHGMSDGLAHGALELPKLLEIARTENANGVILNKGMARAYAADIALNSNLIVQLSAGTRHGLPPYNKTIVCSVPEAVRMGADAVSLHVNIGNDMEDRMLSDFGMLTDEAHQLGLPVMAILYARGGQIVNEHDPSLIAHCIRLGGEMGADMVSVLYSGDPESFSAAIKTCPAPVLITGGPSQPDFDSFLEMVKEALECGAAGVVIGRNIFQHKTPEKALKQLSKLVRNGE